MSPRVQNRLPPNIELVAAQWILRRDAVLTREEEAEFARWQAEDSLHAEAVARKDKAWSTLDRPLQSGQADLLLERLAARAATRRRRRLSAAAGIAVVLVATSFFPLHRMWSPVSAEAQGVVLLPETRTLPDGSVVELRPGAEIVVDFDGPLRRVMLTKGAAHFEVAKGQPRPFVVKVGSVEFRAIGTAFSVEVGSSQIEVLVTEGTVSVENVVDSSPAGVAPAPASAGRPGTSEPNTLATVDAGNRLVVELLPQPTASAPVPTAISTSEMIERLAWRVPKLEFSELPLDEAVALMNRYNKVQFAIEDVALGRLRISGFFRADNIDTFVRLLEGTCGVKAERSGNTIVLKQAGR